MCSLNTLVIVSGIKMREILKWYRYIMHKTIMFCFLCDLYRYSNDEQQNLQGLVNKYTDTYPDDHFHLRLS